MSAIRRLEVTQRHLIPSEGRINSEECSKKGKGPLLLDGASLTPEALYDLGHDHSAKLELSTEAWNRVREGNFFEGSKGEKKNTHKQRPKGRKVVDDVVKSGKVTYGINTGFGNFANVVVDASQLEMLQTNLIRSHAVGVGAPLPLNQARMLCVLRINVLAKGYSGISVSTLKRLIELFNRNFMPLIPSQGTVGASGDLCPLAHLALGLLGEGDMWDPAQGKYVPAGVLLEQHHIKALQLKAKEGLALINGTQFISAVGVEAVIRARGLERVADIVAAFSLEVLQGTWKAYLPQLHAARPHVGQVESAKQVSRLLRGWKSEVSDAHTDCGKVQDAYSLRCVPQIHGICKETIQFCYNILQVEINSATDNPMVFAETNQILSGGNFHGEYPAKACDFLAIGVHELASVSERRIERLVNSHLNGHLPPFLVKNGGLNSGYMIAHVTAASLVSENKGLCHPSSVDSIPTSAGQEDHVSMGGWAARKALRVVENVEFVLAVELLCACQALDFLRPLTSTKPIEAVWNLVRSQVTFMDSDRYLSPDIQKCAELIRSGQVWKVVTDAFKIPSDLDKDD